MIVAGLCTILVLLAALLADEALRVSRSSVVGLSRHRIVLGGVLAVAAAALVLPRLAELLL